MSRAVLAAIAVAAVLASCGGADDPRPAPEPATRGFVLGRSPDAGISEGHAVADKRALRCRAAHPMNSHGWRRCNRNAR